MLNFILGLVLGIIATALVYRRNEAKAAAAVDKGVAAAEELLLKAKSKIK